MTLLVIACSYLLAGAVTAACVAFADWSIRRSWADVDGRVLLATLLFWPVLVVCEVCDMITDWPCRRSDGDGD